VNSGDLWPALDEAEYRVLVMQKKLHRWAVRRREYIDSFNDRPLHGEIAMVPPVEYEQQYSSESLVMKSTKTKGLSLH